jgi:hypothetical protein
MFKQKQQQQARSKRIGESMSLVDFGFIKTTRKPPLLPPNNSSGNLKDCIGCDRVMKAGYIKCTVSGCFSYLCRQCKGNECPLSYVCEICKEEVKESRRVDKDFTLYTEVLTEDVIYSDSDDPDSDIKKDTDYENIESVNTEDDYSDLSDVETSVIG